jgi:heme-degrading monooxygenase HmoA
MVTLHIHLRVRSGQEARFEELYQKTYVPAISKQEGFRRTQLLRPYEGGSEYEIDIYFDSEDLRERWANSPEHQEVWPQVEEMCAESTPRGFDILAEDS